MSLRAYYLAMRDLAHDKRAEYDVTTELLNLNVVARIYRAEGITLDRRIIKSTRIRAAYFNDVDGCSVVVKKNLPREPKLFALVHELKHHFVDRDAVAAGEIRCGDYNAHQVIEKGAEVFAAEFIYPEAEMRTLAVDAGVHSGCTAEDVCRLKHVCPAPVSFRFLVKRLEWWKFCERGAFGRVKFSKLYENIYGLPIYKQEWFRTRRAKASSPKP